MNVKLSKRLKLFQIIIYKYSWDRHKSQNNACINIFEIKIKTKTIYIYKYF